MEDDARCLEMMERLWGKAGVVGGGYRGVGEHCSNCAGSNTGDLRLIDHDEAASPAAIQYLGGRWRTRGFPSEDTTRVHTALAPPDPTFRRGVTRLDVSLVLRVRAPHMPRTRGRPVVGRQRSLADPSLVRSS